VFSSAVVASGAITRKASATTMNNSCPHQQAFGNTGWFRCTGGKYDGKIISSRFCKTCLKSPELPPLQTQAANAAKAVGRVLLAAAQGAPVFATKETQDARLAICHACDQWIEKRKRCAKCGCFTDKKIKLATERCPLGKWAAEQKLQGEFSNGDMDTHRDGSRQGTMAPGRPDGSGDSLRLRPESE